MASGRRTSLASLAGAKVDDVPGRSDPLLLTLPLTQLVATRFNPRRNFGTEEDLKAFGLILKKRQLQPAVVVSRTGYLKLWPEEEENVGPVPYVIANGERRYRGSLAAGLSTLNVVHNEGVASSRADFLDAVLSENNDREDLDPIERALGIETMVAELGGADQVAAHYEKSKGWVSQQRKLLKLTPKLQDLVSAGELPIRIGRDIAGLPAKEQEDAWRQEVSQRAEAKAVRKATPAPELVIGRTAGNPTPRPASTAVQDEKIPPAVPSPTADRFTAVNHARADVGVFEELERSRDSVPEPRQDPAPVPAPAAPFVPEAPQGPRKMPWHDGVACAHLVIRKMESAERLRMIKQLLEYEKQEQEARGEATA